MKVKSNKTVRDDLVRMVKTMDHKAYAKGRQFGTVYKMLCILGDKYKGNEVIYAPPEKLIALLEMLIEKIEKAEEANTTIAHLTNGLKAADRMLDTIGAVLVKTIGKAAIPKFIEDVRVKLKLKDSKRERVTGSKKKPAKGSKQKTTKGYKQKPAKSAKRVAK